MPRAKTSSRKQQSGRGSKRGRRRIAAAICCRMGIRQKQNMVYMRGVIILCQATRLIYDLSPKVMIFSELMNRYAADFCHRNLSDSEDLKRKMLKWKQDSFQEKGETRNDEYSRCERLRFAMHLGRLPLFICQLGFVSANAIFLEILNLMLSTCHMSPTWISTLPPHLFRLSPLYNMV